MGGVQLNENMYEDKNNHSIAILIEHTWFIQEHFYERTVFMTIYKYL